MSEENPEMMQLYLRFFDKRRIRVRIGHHFRYWEDPARTPMNGGLEPGALKLPGESEGTRTSPLASAPKPQSE